MDEKSKDVLRRNQTVLENLELMQSFKYGGMNHLLLSESMGGNAGTYQGRSCSAANFYYDPETAKINVFGNIQDIPKEIRDHSFEGMYRVLMQGERRIISRSYDARTSQRAAEILDASKETYNDQPIKGKTVPKPEVKPQNISASIGNMLKALFKI